MKDKKLREKVEYPNVRVLVDSIAEFYKDNIAYSYRKKITDEESVKISFRQLREDVQALGTELIANGCKGSHVGIIGKLSYDWVCAYFATLAIGAVAVPLDKEWTATDLSDTVSKADVKYLFIDSDLKSKADEIDGANGINNIVYMGDDNSLEGTLRAWIREGAKRVEGGDSSYYEAEIDSDALSLLVFTSGTTGQGKGVMLSQKAFLSDIADVIPYVDFTLKSIALLPPHHTFGSCVNIIGHASIGAELYISAGIKYVLKELAYEKPGHLVLVPLYLETFYRKILLGIQNSGKEEMVKKLMSVSNGLLKVGIDVRRKLFSSILKSFGGNLRMVVSGGAPINKEIITFFEALGISTLNGYGITECAPIISVNHSFYNIHGSVGKVLDVDTVKIVNANQDGEGEIYVKGPNVMLGYYKNDEATAEAFDDEGFFKTGDYGKFENGVLYITGRLKNVIVLANGKNVYPEEIENELIATPGMLEIIVYEGQSKRGVMNNAIVAEIFPDYEYLKNNGIDNPQQYFQDKVNNYNRTAVPYKKVAIVKLRESEFPKNTLRKILRFKLDRTID